MRVLAFVVVLFVAFSGWHWLRREQNEDRLALVASQLAQREVEVSCPGFWTKLVEITPYSGWVEFDEHGRPADRTQLSAATCSSLERLWRDGPPAAGCLLGGAGACPRSTLELVHAMLTLAHEAWHLRGVTNEAQTQCYAVQTTELAARSLGFSPREAAIVAFYIALDHARAPLGEYHSPDCRSGGPLDLMPTTREWPSS